MKTDPKPKVSEAATDEANRFWRARWASGQIGFHEGKVNARLERHVARLEALGVTSRVFVPLAGRSVDVRWLAERGHDVVACELVDEAVRAFFVESRVAPETIHSDEFDVLSAELGPGRVTYWVGDVLRLGPSLLGPVDAVFDRAALIALAPEVRPRYAERLLDFLRPFGRILLVTIEHDAGAGPPFSVSPEEVERIYGGRADVAFVEREDITTESAHIVAKGATSVREAVYLLTVR